MEKTKAQGIAGEIIDLYRKKGGNNYAGEEITQLEHACQTAQLAAEDHQKPEVILAAFLHDLGHLLEEESGAEEMDGFGIKDHKNLNTNYLKAKGFPDLLTTLIKSHVEAKRY